MRRKYFILGALLTILLLVLSIGAGMGLAVAGPNDVSVTMSGVAGSGSITYSMVVSNKGTDAIGNVYVAGSIPSGATFDSVGTPLPAGVGSLGQQGNVVAFLITSVPANGSVTVSYTLKGTTIGAANAWISWKAPSAGSAMSTSVTQAAATAAAAPKRGCQSCHTGTYTLAREAADRVAADYPGQTHPTVSPSGVSIKPTDQTGPAPCLECHAPGTGARTGMGNIAPIALRDIVHPAHMFSEHFKDNYGGNCFTCHNVDGQGNFVLLGDAVDTNDKGVPTALLQGKGSVKGQLSPSEGSH